MEQWSKYNGLGWVEKDTVKWVVVNEERPMTGLGFVIGDIINLGPWTIILSVAAVLCQHEK